MRGGVAAYVQVVNLTEGVRGVGGTIGPVTENGTLALPADLLPADGRFGSGPSKVRPEQIDYLASIGRTVLGHLPPAGPGQEPRQGLP